MVIELERPLCGGWEFSALGHDSGVLLGVLFAVSFPYLMYFVADCQISDARPEEGVPS